MKFSHFALYFPLLNLSVGWIGSDIKVNILRAKVQPKANLSTQSLSRQLGPDSNTTNSFKNSMPIKAASKSGPLDFLKMRRRLILPVESQTGVNSLPDR